MKVDMLDNFDLRLRNNLEYMNNIGLCLLYYIVDMKKVHIVNIGLKYIKSNTIPNVKIYPIGHTVQAPAHVNCGVQVFVIEE
jgi:hypothetical protein